MRIAFIGDLTVDVYKKQRRLKMGGAALNMAIWARRLGVSASIFSAVGTDPAGNKILKKIKSEKISSEGITQLSGITSTIDIFTDDEGEKSYGEWKPGTLADYHIREAERKVLALHRAVVLTVYPQIIHLSDELAQLHKKKRHPLMVINYGDLGEFGKNLNIVRSSIVDVDVLFFGFDKDEDEEMINELKQLAVSSGKLIVITLGKYGSVAYKGENVFVQPPQIVKVKDTTGAGDSFLVGFLATYLKTKNVQKALAAGTTLASRAITKLGAY